MDAQLIPGPDQVMPEFSKFRESVADKGLHWSPEETLTAWNLYKAGPGDDDDDGDDATPDDETPVVKGKGKR